MSENNAFIPKNQLIILKNILRYQITLTKITKNKIYYITKNFTDNLNIFFNQQKKILITLQLIIKF